MRIKMQVSPEAFCVLLHISAAGDILEEVEIDDIVELIDDRADDAPEQLALACLSIAQKWIAAVPGSKVAYGKAEHGCVDGEYLDIADQESAGAFGRFLGTYWALYSFEEASEEAE